MAKQKEAIGHLIKGVLPGSVLCTFSIILTPQHGQNSPVAMNIMLWAENWSSTDVFLAGTIFSQEEMETKIYKAEEEKKT